MSIGIKKNAKQRETISNNPSPLNFLPAKIKGNGEANVKKHFKNYTGREQHIRGSLSNSLRGYPLMGEERSVPAGYIALVLKETNRLRGKKNERELRIIGTFDKFQYWNYDKGPSKSDGYRQALRTLATAEELAKPITESDVEKEIAARKEQLAAKKKSNV